METKLNIFLFFAFILILGLCYLIKNDETAEYEMKVDMFSENNIQQIDSIAEKSVTVDFQLKDSISTVHNKNQK